MSNELTKAEIYEALARLEREGHPRPWEAFEYCNGSIWQAAHGIETMLARARGLYPIRLKPQLPPMVERTIRYPEPVREPLRRGQKYWVVFATAGNYCTPDEWADEHSDFNRLRRARIHLTERNARAHGMAEAGCEWSEIQRVLMDADGDSE